MSEREIVLDQPEMVDEQAEALRNATERAERAEAELAKVKSAKAAPASKAEAPVRNAEATKQPPSPSTALNAADQGTKDAEVDRPGSAGLGGEEELRKDSMMAHLLDSLDEGKDIGHYGRLVFAMVARHFLPHEEVFAWMQKDRDFSDEQAKLMLRQVEGRDYSPPKRERILEWQSQQDFPILLHPDDPDCGNLYRNLRFPSEIYEHIGHYQEAKLDSNE